MESGRRNFIIGYDPLGWREGAFMESGRGNFIMGHERGGSEGPPNIGRREGARGGDKGREGAERGARGGEREARGGEGARGGQRVRGNFNMLRPFRVWGGTLMELGRRHFIMAYNPLRWGGAHGIRKKKFYHGIRPFRVEGIHGIRKRKLHHGTREGVALRVPFI